MFHFPKSPEQSLFMGFWMGEFTTEDKPTRYGKNNHYTYAEQPTVIGQGPQREINIYLPFLPHEFCIFARRITFIYIIKL